MARLFNQTRKNNIKSNKMKLKKKKFFVFFNVGLVGCVFIVKINIISYSKGPLFKKSCLYKIPEKIIKKGRRKAEMKEVC